MTTAALEKAIRDRAMATADDSDDSELLRVLARLVARTTDLQALHWAFGAPGDWGYDTPIGDALAALYRDGLTPQGSSFPSPQSTATTERKG